MPTGIYIRTDKIKRKLSKNHADFSGKNNPMFGKFGKDNPNYGNKHTKKTKRKMSKNRPDFTGKNNPMYNVHRYGENNPNWKGGISCEPYCDVWINKEYKESIKERDNYTCQNPFCLCDNSRLDVHHINYIKKDCKPDNLITICRSSNSKANGNRWFWKEIYKQIIYRNKIKGEIKKHE